MPKKFSDDVTPWGEASLRLEALRIASGIMVTTTQGGGASYSHTTQYIKNADTILSDAEKFAAFVLKKRKA